MPIVNQIDSAETDTAGEQECRSVGVSCCVLSGHGVFFPLLLVGLVEDFVADMADAGLQLALRVRTKEKVAVELLGVLGPPAFRGCFG